MKALKYSDSARQRSAFTLLELLTVMAIIVTLAGIILAGVGFAQQKAARDRATAEIAALGVALESYKVDNGDYPTFASGTGPDPGLPTAATGVLAPDAAGATLLYSKLKSTPGATGQVGYMDFKNDMLNNNSQTTSTHIIDPFGNPYGYSRGGRYNPTTMYDLWSTAGSTEKVKWISNW